MLIKKLLLATIFICGVYSSASPNNVIIESNSCVDLLKLQTSGIKKWAGRIQQGFIRDVQTPDSTFRMGPLFVSQIPEEKPSKLSIIPNKISEILFADPSYRFAPFQGPFKKYIQYPIRRWSYKVFGRAKELGLIITIPMYMYFVPAALDNSYEFARWAKIEYIVHRDAFYLDNLIYDDFRFQVVKNEVKEKKISRNEARKAAFNLTQQYVHYYKFRSEHLDDSKDDVIQSEMKYLSTNLFSHLNYILINGVQKSQAYEVPESSIGPLSPEQVHEIFSVNHDLYLEYQIIDDIIEILSHAKRTVKIDSKLAHQAEKIRSEITGSEFYQNLMQLKRKNKIDWVQFHHALQESAYWQKELEQDEILKIRRYKYENNHFTKEFVQLSDYQKEILEDFR